MADNLFKRGRIYWGRIIQAGVEHRRSLQTGDRVEARKRLEAWRKELSHQAYFGEARHTWAEAVLKWTTEVLHKNVKPRTAARYLTSIRVLDPFWGDLYLDQIDQGRVAKLISARGKVATNATVRRDLTAASSVLSAAVGWGWRLDNPAKTFDRSIIRERRDPIYIPTDEQIDAFVAACPDNLARMVRFLAETGMRLREAGTLEWRDVRGSQVTLVRTKTNRPRTLNLATPGGDAHGTLHGTARHMTAKWVFWHDDGQPYRNLSTRLCTIGKRIKKDFTVHSLRHAFAVRWLRNGGDIYKLQKHLGHSSIKTTEIYLGHVELDHGTNHGTEASVSQEK